MGSVVVIIFLRVLALVILIQRTKKHAWEDVPFAVMLELDKDRKDDEVQVVRKAKTKIVH